MKKKKARLSRKGRQLLSFFMQIFVCEKKEKTNAQVQSKNKTKKKDTKYRTRNVKKKTGETITIYLKIQPWFLKFLQYMRPWIWVTIESQRNTSREKNEIKNKTERRKKEPCSTKKK